ncbi:MAG: Lar family restriction alleviation protein, partial [Synergistaceae bacterium]|nr:Lar family restriction alleviation protein [Synergistaceae bacterium]
MSKELKACPFCGGKAEIRHVKAFYDNKSGKHLGYFVLCPKCLTSSDNYSSEDNAANHWNKRLKRNSYRFYQNTDCEYYPCHQVADTENFSCLFCYCP